MKFEELVKEKERLEILLKTMEEELRELGNNMAVLRHNVLKNKRQLLIAEINGIKREINNYCNHLWYYLKTENAKPMGICLKCYFDGEILPGDTYIEVEHPSFYDDPVEESFLSMFQQYQQELNHQHNDKAFIRKHKPKTK